MTFEIVKYVRNFEILLKWADTSLDRLNAADTIVSSVPHNPSISVFSLLYYYNYYQPIL